MQKDGREVADRGNVLRTLVGAKRNAAAVAAVVAAAGEGGGRGGGSRKIADKRMRIRARMENAEKDIAAWQGNANREKALRRCSGNHERI
jgi:50S ribosomal subunit-associated GTPase HflX